MDTESNEPIRFTLPATRHDGWTGDKMAIFCETLADTGIVVEACDAARMSPQSAYALRRRNPVFAAAWDAALTIARDKLADTLLARSIEGNSELILREGVIVGERQVIDNRLGLAILRRLDLLAETGLSVSTRGLRAGRAPAPRRKPMDWDLALTALRTGEADDLAAALAMLKSYEVDEVDGPPFSPIADWDEEEDAEEYEPDLSGRCWKDDEIWMTDFPAPADFAGKQHGRWSEPDYARECTEDEAAALDAMEAADAAEELAEDTALRDSFFAELMEAAGRNEAPA